MLAALTLCLGLQSGVVGAAPGPDAPALRVFVEDEAGTLLVERWSVRVGRWTGSSIHWVETRPIDATSGVAEFSALTDRTCVVEALHDTGEASDREQIVLRPAEEGSGPTVHGLVFEGPTPERSLFVTVVDPLDLSDTSTLHLFAIDRAGAEIPLRAEPDASRRYAARGVEPGSYRIEVRDPRYARVLLERHTTGVSANAPLTGSASVHVRFVDAVDGRPIAPSSHSMLLWTESSFQQTTGGISTTGAGGAAAASEVVVPGLVPGASVRIEASFDAHCFTLVELTDFTPGEARIVTKQVDRGRTAHGAVVAPDGAAVADVPIKSQGDTFYSSTSRVLPGSQLRGIQPTASVSFSGRIVVRQVTMGPGTSTTLITSGSRSGAAIFPQQSAAARTTTTDQTGHFVLRGLAPDITKVFATFSPWHQEAVSLPSRAAQGDLGTSDATLVDAPVVVRARGAGSADLQFRLPSGRIHGFELSLQIGDGPWLRQEEAVAPLVDESRTMRLRGLAQVPCRLMASVRTTPTVPPLAAMPPEPYLTFEFVPNAGFPTFVHIDLTPLAPIR